MRLARAARAIFVRLRRKVASFAVRVRAGAQHFLSREGSGDQLTVGKAIVIAACGCAALLLLDMLIFASREGLARDAHRLALSGSSNAPNVVERQYRELYGAAPSSGAAEAIRRRLLSTPRPGQPLILDSITTDHIALNWGGVDARTLPAGVYIGARAMGPDEPPLVDFTKYIGHLIIPFRHAYLLFVPEDGGMPLSFSSGLRGDLFEGEPSPILILAMREYPYDPRAYDFPSPGQSVHELFAITHDPARYQMLLAATREEVQRINAADLEYQLLRRNSNSVVGQVVRTAAARSGFAARLDSPRMNLRLPGLSRRIERLGSDQ